jgi:hypothetical protein
MTAIAITGMGLTGVLSPVIRNDDVGTRLRH